MDYNRRGGAIDRYSNARFRQLAIAGLILAHKWADWFLSKAAVLAFAQKMQELGLKSITHGVKHSKSKAGGGGKSKQKSMTDFDPGEWITTPRRRL